MTRKLLASLTLVLLAQPLYAQHGFAQNGTRNGAVLGGVGGAVIGGIIGHQNDETPEGALIGGAVGAVAGGLIGNARQQQVAREQQAARDRYYQQQRNQHHNHHYNNYNTYRSVAPTQSVVVQSGVTIADVLSMTRNGVGESVIINHIYSTGVQRRIDTNEIITLHQQGVPENVINAMQQAPIRTSTYATRPTMAGSSATTIMTPPGGTVIVQEQYGTPTYAAPNYNQPPYSQPTYARPSHYHSYPTRRGF